MNVSWPLRRPSTTRELGPPSAVGVSFGSASGDGTDRSASGGSTSARAAARCTRSMAGNRDVAVTKSRSPGACGHPRPGVLVSEYNPTSVPRIWQPWVRSLRGQSPTWLAALDATVRMHVLSKRGGMPDVVAWNDEEPLRSAIFVECKGLREAVSEAQEDWLWAARHAGVELSQIAVSLVPSRC